MHWLGRSKSLQGEAMNSTEMLSCSDGTKVWASGNGPPMILLHGVLFNRRMWSEQIADFSERYRVLCFDMLGHGEAPDPPGKRTLADFVSQVRSVVEFVAPEEPPVLVGFSMGGMVAQAYAIRYPRSLQALVIINAVYDRSHKESEQVDLRYRDNCAYGVEYAVESGKNRWLGGQVSEIQGGKLAKVFDMMRSGDFRAKLKAHEVFVNGDKSIAGKLHSVACPTLIMTGQLDTGSTPEMARRMAAEIPCSELQITTGQHHLLPILDSIRANQDSS